MATPNFDDDLTPEEIEELVRGVIEGMVTVNRLFEKIPFDGIPGGNLIYKKKDDDNG